jgi:hypothetical protein
MRNNNADGRLSATVNAAMDAKVKPENLISPDVSFDISIFLSFLSVRHQVASDLVQVADINTLFPIAFVAELSANIGRHIDWKTDTSREVSVQFSRRARLLQRSNNSAGLIGKEHLEDELTYRHFLNALPIPVLMRLYLYLLTRWALYRRRNVFPVSYGQTYAAIKTVATKRSIFWDKSCSPVKTSLRFEGTYSLHLQAGRVS